jgi:hypothetical protein
MSDDGAEVEPLWSFRDPYNGQVISSTQHFSKFKVGAGPCMGCVITGLAVFGSTEVVDWCLDSSLCPAEAQAIGCFWDAKACGFLWSSICSDCQGYRCGASEVCVVERKWNDALKCVAPDALECKSASTKLICDGNYWITTSDFANAPPGASCGDGGACWGDKCVGENWQPCSSDLDCGSWWCGCNYGFDKVCLPDSSYPKDCF